MDESAPAFDYVYTRYVVECAENGNRPLTPEELLALLEALPESSDGRRARMRSSFWASRSYGRSGGVVQPE